MMSLRKGNRKNPNELTWVRQYLLDFITFVYLIGRTSCKTFRNHSYGYGGLFAVPLSKLWSSPLFFSNTFSSTSFHNPKNTLYENDIHHRTPLKTEEPKGSHQPIFTIERQRYTHRCQRVRILCTPMPHRIG